MNAPQPTPALGVTILGAGASSRMGRPKLLLPWQNTTIIGHLISQWQALAAAQIAIVLRANDSALAAELDRLNFPAKDRIPNPHPERGMFSSILCAANWTGWRQEISGWVITLGDQPHLQTETLRILLAGFRQNPDAICQPAFCPSPAGVGGGGCKPGEGRRDKNKSGGRAAHPVILPRPVFDELKRSRAENLKEFLKLAAATSVQLTINDPGMLLDLDTPEDYIQAQSSHSVA